MLLCENCGAELQQGALICRNCKVRVNTPIKSEPTEKMRPRKEKPVKVNKDVQASNETVGTGSDDVVSVGSWVALQLLMFVPIVNYIILFVNAFSKTANKNKSNYCKAVLILCIVLTLIGIALSLLAVPIIMSSISQIKM